MGALAFWCHHDLQFSVCGLLVPATLLAPKRLLSLAPCGLGSGLGAAVLVALFHHPGLEVIASATRN